MDHSTSSLATWSLLAGSDIPAAVRHATKRIILDTVACAVGGLAVEPGQVVRHWKLNQGGSPEATLLTGERLPVASVVNVHAHLANILDADETLLNWGHFASTIVMPALAIAESTGASGEQVLRAVAVGFDLAARIGLSLPDYEEGVEGEVSFASGRGFSWAAFGTAAAVGRLLDLSEEQMANAFGLVLALTPMHGVLARAVSSDPLPWHKYAMYGAIAEAGTSAAQLVRAGFKADPTVLDDESVAFRSFGARSWDPEVIYADLGKHWYIADTSIKPYPFCRFPHGALDLFKRIVHANGLNPREVDSVEILIPPFAMLRFLSDRGPGSDCLEGYVSMKHAFWMLINDIPPGPKWFSQDHHSNSERQEFSRKIRSRVVDDWNADFLAQVRTDGKFRKVPLGVRVAARSQTWELATSYAKGDPWAGQDYPMTDEELSAKVRSFCTEALDDASTTHLIDTVMRLDELPDMTPLVESFVAKA